MKKSIKRAVSLALIIVLICAFPIQAGADSTGVCFTAVDDKLLELSLSPVYYSGAPYVSARVFAYCGIYYTYFSASETAQLYTSSRNIFFDIANGTAYDENYKYYTASAVLRNGVAYVPVSWMCSYFGLTYSVISGKGYGDILRIMTGNAVLTDNAQYLIAASSLMQIRYEEAYGVKSSSDDTSVGQDRHDTNVTISFIGLPTEKILKAFERYSYKACFFLTQQQAEESADLIRQLICQGYNIGIYCDKSPEQAVEQALTAVYSAALYQPDILFSSSLLTSKCTSYAQNNAMAYYIPDYTIASDATGAGGAIAILDSSQSDLNICIESVSGSEAYVENLLRYLNSNDYSVIALRETSF